MNTTTLPTAPLLKRLFALLYDLFILTALSFAYAALATLIMVNLFGTADSGDYRPMQHGIWFQVGWLLTIVAFYWFFWRTAGQTVGMRAWRLKLVDQEGSTPSHLQILTRIALAPLSLGLAGLGYAWCLIDKNRAAWHDLASKTQVVETPKIEKKNK